MTADKQKSKTGGKTGKSEKQIAVQEALQVTWLLKGQLKTFQIISQDRGVTCPCAR